MNRIQLFALWALIALLLAAANIEPSAEWFEDLVLGGYVLLFG